MATLALSLAGQVVGGVIGGPIGATIGRAVGALAGSAVDSALFSDRNAGRTSAAGADIRVTGSSEGVPIPRVYGWARISGNIIWATRLRRIAARSSGGKGGGQRQSSEPRHEEIVATFALALCEGTIAHVGRIWADGKLLETDGLDIAIHTGGAEQVPDGVMEAAQGEGAVPGYRGLAYLVFDQLPLSQFGNRLPNLSVEVCRPVGTLEPAIRAVCVIPGATEFGYDPTPRVQVLGRGRTAPENTHASGRRSDWDISIDELVALCPNLSHVGLVVSWFGTDLRCAQCRVEPCVEGRPREIKGATWSVAGISRSAATIVSSHGGGAAYGGTPSDSAVRAAISDLKARGVAVTLYPFVMMDIPNGNGLSDPYGHGGNQPAYPWRGRITCDPAPGVVGTPDGTPAAAGQVAAFMANGYRQMVLHYAALAEAAGGVDAILVGSEMAGLTSVRSGPDSFPFVDALRALAGEVRSIVRAGTRITYAADWSEYSGLQPADAPGDKIFHLDPLWADPAIDAVGIDNYMPLADWRDGPGHADAERAGAIHDLDYLRANIAGGEGFDWFYASGADRVAGLRTPITDGAHGEPWVYRLKDMVSWWGLPHHNRVGGVRSPTPTPWVPGSKPIWMTELGCGAVDKGPNAPNAFGDEKSSEDARPPFSSGEPDPLIQRQMLRACLAYWSAGEPGNPESGVYGGPMVDPERIYLWCWDARPFPAFPGLADVWADASNYETGHWLNGRLGAASIAEYLGALAEEYGVPAGRIDVRQPLVEGMVVDGLATMREAGEALVDAGELTIVAGNNGLGWMRPDPRAVLALDPLGLARDEGALVSRRKGDAAESVGRMSIAYIDRERDYQSASVTAVAHRGENAMAVPTGLVLGAGAARLVAEGALVKALRAADTLEVRLPPSLLALEPGDLFSVAGQGEGPLAVEEVREGLVRTIRAGGHGSMTVSSIAPPPRRISVSVPSVGADPVIVVAHLPDGAGGSEEVAGAFAQPWPGAVTLRDLGTDADVLTLAEGAYMGVVEEPFGPGPVGVWSEGEALVLTMLDGHPASIGDGAALAGGNVVALEGADGRWEKLGFARAELIGPGRYRLSRLLRGLDGTAPVTAHEGAMAMVLDGRVARLSVPVSALGAMRRLRAFAGPGDAEGTDLETVLDPAPALPLAPVHLQARRDSETGAVAFSWIRRTRVGGDVWSFGDVPLDVQPEAYRVAILDGEIEVRSFEVTTPHAVYDAGAQIADFGALAPGFQFTVRQMSPVLGPGHPAHGVFP
ncbi:baseplate multidomain protein megatron [Pelagibacterium montanilacus]|uniref:baseplate multidomain protein megatron n=1 Tax=Pelagibacterium montanilacus TaxID=2185280 RepID=UPI000F8CB3A2|nr:glycoside hydrolase/phage tail family protein [Pelagibacterium montanilacus]